MVYLNHTSNELPDLLFVDLNMPRKNGLECLKEIRSNMKFSDVTIVIFSTSLAKKDIEETLIIGANGYTRIA